MFVLDWSALFIAVTLLVLVWIICLAIWRLFWSPLAGFPGSKLAALTLWYECYFDCLKPGGGLYIWKIEEMHKTYGPIVRINPFELHIKDPDFYDQIYASAPSRRDKYEYFVKSPNSDNATGFTVGHDLHRMRREALAPFFSRRKVTELEPRIKAKINQLCERLDDFAATTKPINLTVALLALTMDILTDYSFAEDFAMLKQEDFNVKWRDTILCIMQALPVIRYFGWTLRLVDAMPGRLARLLAPDVSQLFEWKERIRKRIGEVLLQNNTKRKITQGKLTVFEELRDTEKLPAHEKTLDRLTDECSILLIAGSETPAKALAIIFFHLIDKPHQLRRLRDELGSLKHKSSPTVFSDSFPSMLTLEKLPYLSAVVHEGLRLHSGIVTRAQRLAPHPLQYGKWTIPPFTPISSISAFIHYDPIIFPDPQTFKPERWLMPSEDSKGKIFNHDLKRRYLVAFGHGTRSCLGYNLGYSMLYLCVAAIAGRYDMHLFDTTEEDIRLQRDWTVPQPRIGSDGVKVLVKGKIG